MSYKIFKSKVAWNEKAKYNFLEEISLYEIISKLINFFGHLAF